MTSTATALDGPQMPSAATALDGGKFLAQARAAARSLSDTDKRVLDTILNDPGALVRGSVTELAQRAGTAQSSAVRTCQRLGYRGFQDLKLAITRDLAQQEQRTKTLSYEGRIDDTTAPAAILDSILRRSAQALIEATQTVNPELFSEAIDKIAAADRILVVGNGTSSAPAHDAAYRFAALGLLATAPPELMAQHLGARQLNSSSVCVVISHTGANRGTLQVAEAASGAGAYVLAITGFMESPLTRVANAALVAGDQEYGFRLEAMASRIAHLGLVDALFVGVAVRRPAESEKALDLMANITIEHSL